MRIEGGVRCMRVRRMMRGEEVDCDRVVGRFGDAGRVLGMMQCMRIAREADWNVCRYTRV